jgi:hypothetical protein
VLKLPNKQLPQDLLAHEDLGIRENEKKKEVNTSTVPVKNSEMGRDPDLAILTLVGRRSSPEAVEPRVRRRKDRRRRAVALDLESQYATEEREE